MDILDLIPQASNTPAVSSLVDGIHNVGVQGLALLEGQTCEQHKSMYLSRA